MPAIVAPRKISREIRRPAPVFAGARSSLLAPGAAVTVVVAWRFAALFVDDVVAIRRYSSPVCSITKCHPERSGGSALLVGGPPFRPPRRMHFPGPQWPKDGN